MPRIIPIRDLKNTAAVSQMCSESKEPVYITKNGYGDMVIMSMEAYEEKMQLLDAYAKLDAAEQQVEAGQGLIGTARSERDGTLIFAPAAGTVLAQFEWNDTCTVPLEENVFQYTGGCTRSIELVVFGQAFALPAAAAPENAVLTTRHYQPELPLLGLALPCSIQETCRYGQQPETLCRTGEQAAALARMQSLQALYAAWPDAERIARKEDCTVNDGRLNYTVTYTIVADICG